LAVSPTAAAGAPSSEAAKRKSSGELGVLGFTFTAESWVEVTDGTGRTVISRRYKAGEADEVSGRGPFTIVVGNAQATRMAYNGREFDLAPHTRVSVARVTLK
jgi:cytoskeleton protein RodZ